MERKPDQGSRECREGNPPKKKRLPLDLQKKVELIRGSAGKSQRELAEEYGIGLGTVSRIMAKKASLLSEYESDTNGSLPRLQYKGLVYKDINVAVWKWFEAARARNMPVTGPLVQEKALEFGVKMGYPEFKASNGWLEVFKKRHTIAFRAMSRDSNAVPTESVKEFTQRLPEIISKFKLEDVFNCDESGIFYRAVPDQTLTLKGQACERGNVPTDHLTALFCCNATGTEKETVMVVGRSKRPRGFHQVPLEQLPVKWECDKKAWMNIEIFGKWLQFFDCKMRAQKREVLLLLDNACCHPKDIHLTNVTLHYLPSNLSHLQPLNQGIIRATKVLYRQALVRHVLARMETCDKAVDISRSITVIDAIQWLSSAWDRVQRSTIQKCFKKAGFSISDEEETENKATSILDEAELVGLLIQNGLPEDQAVQYTMLDDSLCTDAAGDTEWESNILEQAKACHHSAEDDYNINGSSGDEDDSIENPPSYKEALMFVQGLKTFTAHFEPELLPTVIALEERIEELTAANVDNTDFSSLPK